MRAMKFKVANETQSSLLQQALFKDGYLWGLGNGLIREPRYTSSTYLFAHPEGNLTSSNHPDTFDKSHFEYWGTMAYIRKSNNTPLYHSPNKQIILVEVLGEIYNKKELEAALSNLTRYSVEK